jgi:hypothetical protein
MKHNVAQVGGHDPWEVEVSIWIKHGHSPENARIFTILRWMYNDDLRPLAAAIWQGHALDEAVLNCLAMMIDEGRIGPKGRGRGRRRSPDTFSRDYVAQRFYEAEVATGKSAEEALDEVARLLPATKEIVRRAVTQLRKVSAK